MANNDDRIKMPYAKFGSGPKALVIIPGMSVTNVTDAADAVAKRYVMFCDYTGYIFDRGEKLSSVEAMAEETYAGMKSLGIEKPYILGASQGGMIAMCIAANHPEYPAKICVSSTSAVENLLYRRVCDRWRALCQSGDKKALFEDMNERMYCKQTLELIKKIGGNYSATAEDMSRFIKILDSNRGFDIRDRLSQIKCPMLIFGSRNDCVFGAEETENIARATKARLIMVENYGHALYDEDKNFVKTVYDFFEEE